MKHKHCPKCGYYCTLSETIRILDNDGYTTIRFVNCPRCNTTVSK